MRVGTKARLKARMDNKQMMLNADAESGMKSRGGTIPEEFSQHMGQFLCPFCLHTDTITAYLVRIRTGWSQSRVRCPECEVGFLLVNLTARLTPEDFAIWIWNYPKGYFWKRCSFEVFNRRLKQIGWSYRFWKAYNAQKGENY